MEKIKIPVEAGNPMDDPRAFRRSLGQFATGVTVLTAQHDDHLVGMAVNSFAALSLDPPLVLWSIRKQSGSLPIFSRASHFAVNVLSTDQVQISAHFGSSDPDKFSSVSWTPGLGGAPLLSNCVALFECRLEQMIEGGDHLIVVGRVEQHARYTGQPLLFTQGRYAAPQDMQGVAPTNGATSTPPLRPEADIEQASWLRLLHYASHELSACYDEQRQEEGLNVAEFRIFSWLRATSHTLEELKYLTYLGERNAQDALNEMQIKGHVCVDPLGQYALTDLGRQRADASARRVAAFEAGLTRGIPSADVSITRKVLGRLVHCANGL